MTTKSTKSLAATGASKGPKLPKELAKRAKAAHDLAQQRLVERGREAIARIRRCQTDIAASFVDVGVSARMRLVATRDGKGPKVVIEARLQHLDKLLAALRKAAKP